VRILIASLLAAATLAAQPKPVYEIYAIRYATIKDFAVSGLIDGADRSRKVDIAMMIWLIKGNGRNILFDSGFYRDQFMKQWHPADYSKPSEAIARLSLKPEDITDVVISHIHWDHADGFDLFPKAKIWIQKEEIEYYAGEAWNGRLHRRQAHLRVAISGRQHGRRDGDSGERQHVSLRESGKASADRADAR